MPRRFPNYLSLLAVVPLLAGCMDDVVRPPEPETFAPPPNARGLIRVDFKEVGTDGMQVDAHAYPIEALRRVPGNSGEGPRFALVDPPFEGDGSLQLEQRNFGWFTDGVRGAGGVRYLFATIGIRNAMTDGTPYTNPMNNQMLLGLSVNGTTLVGTNVGMLKRFDNSDADPSIALGIQPTGGVVRDLETGELVISTPDVLQVFTEEEVSSFHMGADSVFPYGFIIRNAHTASHRTIDGNPAPGQYDGSLTLAIKFPLQPTAAEDPFIFSIWYLVLEDTEVRITQSLEEQDSAGLAKFEARADSLGATMLTLLPGTTYRGLKDMRVVCSVRTAGPEPNPSATLFADPPTLSSLSPDPYAATGSSISAGSAIGATFTGAVTDPSARTFVVHRSQRGTAFLSGGYGGDGTATVTAPAGSFFPGEEVEVVLTRGLFLCTPQVARYRVAATGGTGFFPDTTNFAVGTDPVAVALGDMNGDGELDLVAANQTSDDVTISLGSGTGSFGSATSTAAGDGAHSVALADLDGDGDLDLAVANVNAGTVSIFLNDGTGGLSAAVSPIPTSGAPRHVVAGDLDGDGDLDLAVANGSGNDVVVLRNNGTATEWATRFLSAGSDPRGVALGDLDADGDLDLATANFGADSVAILLNDSSAFAAMRREFHPVDFGTGGPVTPAAIVGGDLNGDGAVDLAVANRSTGAVAVLDGDGLGSISTMISIPVGTNPGALAIGDVDGDGDLDLVVGNEGSDDVSVLAQAGDGSLGLLFTAAAGDGALGVGLGALDSDGDLDLVVGNRTENKVSVLLNSDT